MAEDWKAEYDQRQYRLMADQLQGYEEGKLNLASLVSRLEALLSALEAPDKVWKNDFWSIRACLETVYAVAFDRKERSRAGWPNDDDRSLPPGAHQRGSPELLGSSCRRHRYCGQQIRNLRMSGCRPT